MSNRNHIEKVESCDFSCEAGPLVNNTDWQHIKAELAELRARAEPVLDSPATVGAGTFAAGLPWRMVIEAAKRQYQYRNESPVAAPAAAVADVFEGWEITCGGAVVKRIDGKGWNGCAILNDELVSVVEAVPLDTAFIQCNRHAHAARQPASGKESTP